MKAMILAAGRGERMRPLTDTKPKPLLEVGGRALVDYHLEALVRAGVTEVVINLAWLGERIQAHVGDGSKFGLRVAYSDEGPVALETGGGIQRALPLLGAEPFWLVNGDVYCDYPFPERALAEPDLGHLVLVPNPAHHPAGDFALADGRITAGTGPRLTYAGIALLRPALVAGQAPGRFPLAPLLSGAIREGRLSGEAWAGRWEDVGTPARLEALDSLLRG